MNKGMEGLKCRLRGLRRQSCRMAEKDLVNLIVCIGGGGGGGSGHRE